MAKIFIDAGHGGKDPGAVGKKSNEKTNVLKVALKLKEILEKSGHIVRLSRSTDIYLRLEERARLANVWGADYFISLHNNAATASATGFETFVYNGAVQSKTVAFQNVVHAAIAKNIGLNDRGRKRDNFAVLRLTRMPAVLVEYGFISNPKDESILINQVDNLALWTAQGVVVMAGGKVPVSTSQKKEEDEVFNSGSSTLNKEVVASIVAARKVGILTADTYVKKAQDGTLTLQELTAINTLIVKRAYLDPLNK